MTEAEERDRIARQGRDLDKLREKFAKILWVKDGPTGTVYPSNTRADMIQNLTGLSWAALAWCRANKELVDALAVGTWRAVPVIADQNMVAAINAHHDSASNAGDAVWERALEAAPKKPEE